MQIYLAAPFANPVETGIVRQLRQVISDTGHDLANPFFLEIMPRLRKPALRQGFFAESVYQIQQADLVIAALERFQLDSKTVVKRCKPDDFGIVRPFGPPLQQPACGVVWEMGAAFSMDKPVVGFCSALIDCPLNLMLLEGCWGLVKGWEQLRRFLRSKPETMGQHFTPYEGGCFING